MASDCRPPQRAASFRDPDGCVIRENEGIWRLVREHAADSVQIFLNSSSAKRLVQSGKLIESEILERDHPRCPSHIVDLSRQGEWGLILSHERIDFPSFPYEWPPEMLYEAGALTLEIANDILDEGLGLKDATPYNILYRGSRPVFTDLLSFERRDAADPTWLPLAQFQRTFLLPLLANKFFGLRLDHILVSSRDGIEPRDLYRFLRLHQMVSPLFLSHICMPTWLSARADRVASTLYQKKLLNDPEKALFVLRSLISSLQKNLAKLRPDKKRVSAWNRYMHRNCSYSHAQFAAKEEFLREIMIEHSPGNVLDVGCNTGHFSVLAAEHGARVVSIDKDPVVVGKLWQRAVSDNLDILPLVIDLARPSPATGWLNQECPSFLERAHGHFDAVIALAILHHMLVGERIPLRQILQLFAALTRNLLVIEFIAPQDPMFTRISRGRDHLFGAFTAAAFESAVSEQFEIRRVVPLGDNARTLYLCVKR